MNVNKNHIHFDTVYVFYTIKNKMNLLFKIQLYL